MRVRNSQEGGESVGLSTKRDMESVSVRKARVVRREKEKSIRVLTCKVDQGKDTHTHTDTHTDTHTQRHNCLEG